MTGARPPPTGTAGVDLCLHIIGKDHGAAAANVRARVLAERAHLARRTFARRFRQETGTSLLAWLTLARIDWARELLQTTNVPVEHVARLRGLGSPAAFRATFHRRVGTSPADYRATFQHPVQAIVTRETDARPGPLSGQGRAAGKG